ncbi:MAG: transcriptional regulator [Sphingosinicella sp.]|nr:transcriptional regulator [Sphingosinicella sp.]
MKLHKLTKEQNVPRKRRFYDDACGTAHGLELIGERWALLILRELMLGPKRFSDIRADLPGISANVLTQRLEGLEANGLLIRRKLPPPSSAQVYELTQWGYEAEPVIKTLGRWAVRSPDHDPTMQISPVSLMLSFRTMIDAERAKGVEARIGFRVGGECFLGQVFDGDIVIKRDPLDNAEATFIGEPAMLATAVYDRVPLRDLVKDGSLIVTGDWQVAERFLNLFTLPSKFDPPEPK